MTSLQQEVKKLREYMEASQITAGTLALTEAAVTKLTTTASKNLAIEAATGKDITVEMGDASAANKVSFIDSDESEQVSIDSNGVLTAKSLVGALTGTSAGTHTGDIAATSKSALNIINSAADKNIVFKLGEAAGATKISFTDSGNAEVASIDSNGVIDGSSMVSPLKYAEAETDGAPTNDECISAFGTAAAVGAGFAGVLQDSAAGGVSYICVSNGTNYDVFTGVAGG
jgi:hypothetical protein